MGQHKLKKNKKYSKNSKTKLTIFIVAAVIAGIAYYDYSNRTAISPLEVFDPARSKGNPQAEIKIVEFADFQCSHCAVGAKILGDYLAKYPNKMHLNMKYFPLAQQNSNNSALNAQCAAKQDRFWPFHDIIFAQQSKWRKLMDAQSYFNKVASEVGLNLNEFKVCLNSRQSKKVLREEKTLGESMRIRSTPTYFVNGEMVVGTISLEAKLKSLLELSEK